MQRINKFSLRKKSVGLASVLVGMGAGVTNVSANVIDNEDGTTTLENGKATFKVDTDKFKESDKSAEELYKAGEYAKEKITEGSDKIKVRVGSEINYVTADGTVIDEKITDNHDIDVDINYEVSGKSGKKYKGDDSIDVTPDKNAGKKDKIVKNGKTYRYVRTDVVKTGTVGGGVTRLNDVSFDGTVQGMHKADGSIDYSKTTGRVWLVEEKEDGTYGKFKLIENGAGLTDEKVAELSKEASGTFSKNDVDNLGGMKDTDTVLVYETNTYAAVKKETMETHGQYIWWSYSGVYANALKQDYTFFNALLKKGFNGFEQRGSTYYYKNRPVNTDSDISSSAAAELVGDVLISKDYDLISSRNWGYGVIAEFLRDFYFAKLIKERDQELKMLATSMGGRDEYNVTQLNNRPTLDVRYKDVKVDSSEITYKQEGWESLLYNLYTPKRLEELVSFLDGLNYDQSVFYNGSKFERNHKNGFLNGWYIYDLYLEAKENPSRDVWVKLIDHLNSGSTRLPIMMPQYTPTYYYKFTNEEIDVVDEILNVLTNQSTPGPYMISQSLYFDQLDMLLAGGEKVTSYRNKYGEDKYKELVMKITSDNNSVYGDVALYKPVGAVIKDTETFTYHDQVTPLRAYRLNSDNIVINHVYEEVKQGSVITNHYLENTTTKLADSVRQDNLDIDSKYSTASVNIPEKVETEDLPDRAIKRTINYELVSTPDNANGNVKEGETVVNYYYRKVVKEDVTMKKDTVIANYYKEGSEEKLADSEVQNELVIGTDYITNAKVIEPKVETKDFIDRTVKRTITYELVKEPENKTGKVAQGGTTVNYYYREIVKEDVTMKKDGLIVNYYKEGTEEKLADSDVQTGLTIGSDYTTKAKVIEPKVSVEDLVDRTIKRTVRYELVEEPGNKDGVISVGGTIVNYYYKEVVNEDVTMKKDMVTANYYKDGTTEKLADSEVQNGLVIGTDYTTVSKTIPQKVSVEELPDRTVKRTVTYELIKEPENKIGKVAQGGTTVNYYYKEVVKEDVTMKKDMVTTNYYKEGTEEKLADSIVQNGLVIGSDYKTESKVIESKVTVDEFPDRTVKRTVSYELVREPENKTGKVAQGGTTVNYYYKEVVKEDVTMKKDGVIANYYKEGTTEKLAESVIQTDKVIGSDYSTDAKSIEPKVSVEELADRTVTRTMTYALIKDPVNKTGKIVKGGTVVNYYYKDSVKEDVTMKKDGVVANYYKEGTTEKLADSVVQNDRVIGTDYTTESKIITSKITVDELPDKIVKRTTTYVLVKEPENKTGKITKGGTIVNYYYKEVVKEDVTMKHGGLVVNYYKEGTTEKLADSVIETNNVVGSEYTTKMKVIEPKVTVDDLPDRTVKRTVNYELVREPENKMGKIVQGETVVNYYYKEVIKEDIMMKKDGVVANYFKEGTNEKLADSVIETDKVIGSDYATKAKVIEPKVLVEELPDKTIKRTVTYELVKEPTNKNGKVVKGGVVVNYYYREIVKEDVTKKEQPIRPTEPIKPILPAKPTEPKKVTKPIAPTKPIVYLIEPKEPTKPIIVDLKKPTKPVEPIKPRMVIDPNDGDAGEIKRPVAPVKPIEPVKPVEPKEPEKIDMEKPTKPIAPVKPVEPVKPKEDPKTEEPRVEPFEQSKVETKKKLPETGDTTNLAVMGLGALIAARRLRRKEQ